MRMRVVEGNRPQGRGQRVTQRCGWRVENAVVKVSRMLEEGGSKNRVGHPHVVGADAQTPKTERRKVRAWTAGMCFQRI